ncbi:MAG: calcium-binding protein, partial [Paracoccaceae bacterium]
DAETLMGGAGDDFLFGRGGQDALFGQAGDDVLIASAEPHQLFGGVGFDRADFSRATSGVDIDLGSTAGQGGGATGKQLFGIEAVIGSDHADTLAGNDDANLLSGGLGNDLLTLGRGDTVMGDDGNDTVMAAAGAATVIGGEGFDLLDYSNALTGFVLDLSDPGANTGMARGHVISEVENFAGSRFDDTLVGSNRLERLFGNAGDDLLIGKDGANRLYGGEGDDRMLACDAGEMFFGGEGRDSVDFGRATQGIRLDLIDGSLSSSIALNSSFSEIEVFAATHFNDSLRGSYGAEILYGRDGNDVLIGRGGGDTLYGGAGNDIIAGTSWAEHANGGDGFDIVSYALATGAVRASLMDTDLNGGAAAGDRLTEIEGLVGSVFDDVLMGANTADFLVGGTGDDRIQGLWGDDRLFGGIGIDKLNGGYGSDTLWGGDGADILIGLADNDFAAYRRVNGEGVRADLANAAGNTGQAAGDRYTAIEGLIGTVAGDTLGGNSQSNTLIGNRGDDVLIGRDGRDLLKGGSGADMIDGGAGFDTVLYSGRGAVVVDLLTPGSNRGEARGDQYFGIEAFVGTNGRDGLYGNTKANQFSGDVGNDVLVGRGGNDVLFGGAGDDFINGGKGIDRLYGGLGADRFVFGNGDGPDFVHGFLRGQGDRLQFTAGLVGERDMSAFELVQRFGSVLGGSVVLNFGGGDRVTLHGVNSLDGLWQSIQII